MKYNFEINEEMLIGGWTVPDGFRIFPLAGTVFKFQVNNTQTIGGQFSTITGKTISIDWGDGSARSKYSGTDQVWSKDYGSAGNRTVRMYSSSFLTKLKMDASGANISFDIANLPSSLTYFLCVGANTVSGDIANLSSSLTYFNCVGANTVSGDIANLPSSLTYFLCYGANTVSGDIANLSSSLTYFNCVGANTVSGDIANLPSSLTLFRCLGANTVSGDIANLSSSLTYFNCLGANTVSGDIANLSSSLTHFNCLGANTVSDYTTPHTWTVKPVTFILVPVGAGGLSEGEIDNLLIDFDADLTWASGDVITLTGTNAARSSASDAAVTNMTNEGATVTTN